MKRASAGLKKRYTDSTSGEAAFAGAGLSPTEAATAGLTSIDAPGTATAAPTEFTKLRLVNRITSLFPARCSLGTSALAPAVTTKFQGPTLVFQMTCPPSRASSERTRPTLILSSTLAL